MTTASTLEEHATQLASMIEGPPRDVLERQRRFVDAFVRPHGTGVPATDLVVGRLEEIAVGPSRVRPRRCKRPLAGEGCARSRRSSAIPGGIPWFLDEREAARDAMIAEKETAAARIRSKAGDRARKRPGSARRRTRRARKKDAHGRLTASRHG